LDLLFFVDIIHNLVKFNSLRKNVQGGEASLMLAGGGSYLWMGRNSASRYQGWFFESGKGLVKIIDNIYAKNAGGFLALENNFWRAKRIWQNNVENFLLLGSDCLSYEINNPAEIEFFLDVKETYKNPEFGRHYSVWQENDLLMINYRQEKDFCLPEIFAAVCGDMGDIQIKNKWICREYAFDKKRDSKPFKGWVFLPAAVFASKLIFVVGTDKKKTMARAREIWRNYEKIKKEKQRSIHAPSIFFAPVFASENEKENLMARNCARNAINSLLCAPNSKPALRAGLPWFFQIWQRDEAISLAGLAIFDWQSAREIFWRQIDELKNNDYRFNTADGIGWLFLAVGEFVKQNKFNQKEKREVFDCLRKSIDYLLENNTQNDLAINDDCQKTWMDSLNRSGAAIEIQALRLNMYSLAARLANNKKEKGYYAGLKKDLKEKICQKFLNKFQLADKFDVDNNLADFTARPNIFLAAYIYPGLFSKSEWAKIFDWALPKLWLDWGGLSTIDKNDPRFCANDTGEDPKSYHNGDSWFWINNIAAIVLARTDYQKFEEYIEKIFNASKNDILWHGAIGYASEISSAQNYEPRGCPNQAWSASAFLQLFRELRK